MHMPCAKHYVCAAAFLSRSLPQWLLPSTGCKLKIRNSPTSTYLDATEQFNPAATCAACQQACAANTLCYGQVPCLAQAPNGTRQLQPITGNCQLLRPVMVSLTVLQLQPPAQVLMPQLPFLCVCRHLRTPSLRLPTLQLPLRHRYTVRKPTVRP